MYNFILTSKEFKIGKDPICLDFVYFKNTLFHNFCFWHYAWTLLRNIINFYFTTGKT